MISCASFELIAPSPSCMNSLIKLFKHSLCSTTSLLRLWRSYVIVRRAPKKTLSLLADLLYSRNQRRREAAAFTLYYKTSCLCSLTGKASEHENGGITENKVIRYPNWHRVRRSDIPSLLISWESSGLVTSLLPPKRSSY